MSGMCSIHRGYDRECGLCQSEKPEWVVALESRHEVLLKALREAEDLSLIAWRTTQDAQSEAWREWRDRYHAALNQEQEEPQ